MQQAAYQEFLAQNGIYPGSLPQNAQPSQTNPYAHQNNYCYQTPSITRAQFYTDYQALEKPKKPQKGKSLGSAYPRKSSDYVDFSKVNTREKKESSHQKVNVSKAPQANFGCIQEAASRTAASCENLSSTQAWNCVEQGHCVHHNKKKKSKFLPKFIPNFFRRRNKSKHEKGEEVFIAVQNLPNLRKRSCTINNCESMEQLYDTPAYETRDFLENRCGNACSRVPPLHPDNNPTPTNGLVSQSDCLNHLQPLYMSSAQQSYCDRSHVRYIQPTSIQHSRNHSFGNHSYYKDPNSNQPIVFQAEDPIQVDKLVYYPIITTDRSNTYVTYYPSTHQTVEPNRRDYQAASFPNNYIDLNAHSNQVYESNFTNSGVNSSTNNSVQQNHYGTSACLQHQNHHQQRKQQQQQQVVNKNLSNVVATTHNYHNQSQMQNPTYGSKRVVEKNQPIHQHHHQQQQQQQQNLLVPKSYQQSDYMYRDFSAENQNGLQKASEKSRMEPNKTSSPVIFANENVQNLTSETDLNNEHTQESMTSCNERKMRSPKVTSSNESSDNVFHGPEAHQNSTAQKGGFSRQGASGPLNSTRDSKNSRRSHKSHNHPSSSSKQRVLSLENSIAATNNHSVSSSPEHKSSGYATLDTANSLLVNQSSPRIASANQNPVNISQSNHSNLDVVVSSTNTPTPRSASATTLQAHSQGGSALPTPNLRTNRQARVPLGDIRKQSSSNHRADVREAESINGRQDSKCTQTYPEVTAQVSAKSSLYVPQSLPSTNPNFRLRKSSVSEAIAESPTPKSPVKSHQVKYYFDFSLASAQPNHLKQNSSQQHSRQNTETYKYLPNGSVDSPPPTTSKNHGRSAPASPVLGERFLKNSSNLLSTKSTHNPREPDYSTITSKHGQRNQYLETKFDASGKQFDQMKCIQDKQNADVTSSGSFYRGSEIDFKKLHQFFDSQGASSSTLRQFRKKNRSSTNNPEDLGSVPDVGDPRPLPYAGVISQQGLVENNFHNPPMTDFEKTLLVLNWLMECQKEINLEKVCYF